MHQAGRRGPHDLPKQIGAKIAVHRGWPEELSVIERVEGLQPELDRFTLAQSKRFQQRQIEIQSARGACLPGRFLFVGEMWEDTGVLFSLALISVREFLVPTPRAFDDDVDILKFRAPV